MFSLTAYRNEYKKIGSTFGSLSAAFAVDVDSESKCLLFRYDLPIFTAITGLKK